MPSLALHCSNSRARGRFGSRGHSGRLIIVASGFTTKAISVLPDRVLESNSPFSLRGWTGYLDRNIAETVPEDFSVYGPQLESAIPVLERLRDNHPNPDVSWAATLAIAGVTTNGIPALVSIIGDPFDLRWHEVVRAFEAFPFPRTYSAPAIPHLKRMLEFEDGGIRREVARLLDGLDSTQNLDEEEPPNPSDVSIRFNPRGVE